MHSSETFLDPRSCRNGIVVYTWDVGKREIMSSGGFTFRPVWPINPTGPIIPESPFDQNTKQECSKARKVCNNHHFLSVSLVICVRNVKMAQHTFSPLGAGPGDMPGSPFFPWWKTTWGGLYVSEFGAFNLQSNMIKCKMSIFSIM